VEQDGSALAPGFRLDRYELLCPVAQGGMAEVWMARQTGKLGFEKLVAVKTILPKFADDERFQRMFLDEAHVSSRIEHPNVAQILDVGEQDDIMYLVMEYVDGDALTTLHRAAEAHGVRIPHGVLLRVMSEVCGGLHAAHDLCMADGQNAGVVHRDVSPHNILVNTKGTAKLIDFGLAKARDRIAEDTRVGMVKGKLRYMAPEQVLGPSVDRRADIWAVGATLYHLVSGEPPYEADTDVEVVRALMSGRPPRRLGHAVHPAVEAVILRSLAWRADERFATALDLQRALEQATRGAGLETSASHVASFLDEHVGDRAQRRQEAITLGMREAAGREGTLGSTRPSGHNMPPLNAIPVPAESRPHENWSGPTLPAPPSSGATRAVTRNSIMTTDPPPRGGSATTVTAAVAGVVVVAGLGLAFGLTHPSSGSGSTGGPPTVISAGPLPNGGSTSVAAAHAAPVAPTAAIPAAATGPSAADSALSMTVKVTDLPVVTPPRPVAVAPRPQPPRPVAAPAPDPNAEAPAPSAAEPDETPSGQ
jgi:serine/threonine protein kinase